MTAMSRALLKFLHAASLLLLLCAAAGCASSARQDPPHEPAQHRLSDFHEEDQDFPVDV